MPLATDLWDRVHEADLTFSNAILRVQGIFEHLAKTRKPANYVHFSSAWNVWTKHGGVYGSLGLVEEEIELDRHHVTYAELRCSCITPDINCWDQLDPDRKGLGIVKIMFAARPTGYVLGTQPLTLVTMAYVVAWLSENLGATDEMWFQHMLTLPKGDATGAMVIEVEPVV